MLQRNAGGKLGKGYERKSIDGITDMLEGKEGNYGIKRWTEEIKVGGARWSCLGV